MKPGNGQNRAVIRDVYPSIDGGFYPIKRVTGEWVNVWADVLADGHDLLNASLAWRHESETDWQEAPAQAIGQNRWHGKFQVTRQGFYQYRFRGWIDYAQTWQKGIGKKIAAGLEVGVELLEGIPFLQHLLGVVEEEHQVFVKECKAEFSVGKSNPEAHLLATSPRLAELFARYPYRPFMAQSADDTRVWVDREKARFSTWYEFFPRSASSVPGQHGTFADCEKILPRVAEMGFDTLYFPPVHPIGEVDRKGKNDKTVADPGDVGSCWGIGSRHGGHTSLHPDLGDLKSFQKLVKTAKGLGIEIAMDLALQCAPDHPWVKEHPAWFKQRPDGTVQFAENPPKKYQDIYPIFFESEDWENLWDEILKVVMFWIDKGIRVFRVDNPHTKPIPFWHWLIGEVRKVHPDIIFLSEAFTLPKIMLELAKAGFTQSYTYFTWRNSKDELIQYLNELTQGPVSEVFRPNFWPNTPDINPYPLQNPSEPLYLTRYFLAATLSSNVGVYGPVYEQMVHQSVPGREEYYDSEKYAVRHWDWDLRNNITHLMTRVNQARKDQKALQQTNQIRFCHLENSNLLAFLKTGEDDSQVLAVVNLDPNQSHHGELHLPYDWLKVGHNAQYQVRDLMSEASYSWQGERHFVALNPDWPFHLFEIKG
ncbi:MAG: alpha-1,4-glucan--maltose-1-phosphate maltosyltransferase [Bacteroidia bacterium]|nr:alpha-1,4-glucan--maltose-1-phosphate maltosyltransferase [Bacteroidia bacterium]